jgi:hypothetical protein
MEANTTPSEPFVELGTLTILNSAATEGIPVVGNVCRRRWSRPMVQEGWTSTVSLFFFTERREDGRFQVVRRVRRDAGPRNPSSDVSTSAEEWVVQILDALPESYDPAILMCELVTSTEVNIEFGNKAVGAALHCEITADAWDQVRELRIRQAALLAKFGARVGNAINGGMSIRQLANGSHVRKGTIASHVAKRRTELG